MRACLIRDEVRYDYGVYTSEVKNDVNGHFLFVRNFLEDWEEPDRSG
jgi:hypothetical protein